MVQYSTKLAKDFPLQGSNYYLKGATSGKCDHGAGKVLVIMDGLKRRMSHENYRTKKIP